MPIDSDIREIIKTDGHIKIDDMMRQVLSLNSGSYYRQTKDIGRKGDFITSPEISQLFGEILALWVIEKWENLGRPQKFALLELGPGQGTLMNDILNVTKLVPEFMAGVTIEMLDINSYFIKKQKNKLSPYIDKITWRNNLKDLPTLPTIVIANEFFDALPIKQYMKTKDRWYELVFITDPLDSRIKYDKIETHKNLQIQLLLDHPNAYDGAIIEESLESLEHIRYLAKHFNLYNGYALIIDYGYNINSSERLRSQYNSTLQAIKEHQYSAIIDSLGEADLTAHVDFLALKQAAAQNGVNQHKFWTQKQFLVDYGIMLRLQLLTQNLSQQEILILHNQVYRLTSQKQMGELFKVLELSYN